MRTQVHDLAIQVLGMVAYMQDASALFLVYGSKEITRCETCSNVAAAASCAPRACVMHVCARMLSTRKYWNFLFV